jgi:peroxiredoxin family protein
MRNETMNSTKCIAVIGGIDYEGESFDSLRLFDCQSTADLYKVKLQQDFDYVLMEVRDVSQYSVMMGGAIDALAQFAA